MPRQRHRDLPLLPSPLIGRRQELAIARKLLLGGARLVSLTGPPGVGKTSLALAVANALADRFEHGVRMVDLAPVAEQDLVAATIADVLGAGGAGRDPSKRIAHLIGDRHLLLVLDNFEQVVEAAPLVSDLLSACTRVVMLVTSRVPLRLRWEHELPIPPLEVSAAGEQAGPEALALVPSVALFMRRARAVDSSFVLDTDTGPVVAEICARLDGLPLAIELAAARTRLLSAAEIRNQLAGNGIERGQSGLTLGVLTGGGRDLPERHRTLTNAMAWSYAQLSAAERSAFRRLAVFVNGCTLEAAELVCGAPWPIVESLVEQSLVRRDRTADGGARLRMVEPIRQYALDQLEASDEIDVAIAHHTTYFLDLAERAAPEMGGPSQAEWLNLLDRERHNLRAAARRANSRGDAETVLRLGAALWQFWWARSDAAEARERVEAILALASVMPPSPARARALHGAGVLAHELADYAGAETMFGQSLNVARQLGDRPTIGDVLSSHGWMAQQRGDYPRARALLDQSLDIARGLDDQSRTVAILSRRGHLAFAEGDIDQARAFFGEALTVAHELDDQRIRSDVLYSLGLTFHAERDLPRARRCFEESRAILTELGHRPALAQTLHSMAALATMERDFAEARALYRQVLTTARGAGNQRRLALVLWAFAVLVGAEGEPALALRLHAAGSQTIESLGVMLARPLRELNEANMAPTLAALREDEIAEARALGRRMTLVQAIDEALAWLAARVPVTDAPAEDAAETPAATTVAGGQTGPTPGRTASRRTARRSADALSRRERDVAILLGRGLTNRQIAAELVLTEGTANSYVKRVLQRLGLNTRAQVAVWAVERGLHKQHIER